jgi:hypothetical protein
MYPFYLYLFQRCLRFYILLSCLISHVLTPESECTPGPSKQTIQNSTIQTPISTFHSLYINLYCFYNLDSQVTSPTEHSFMSFSSLVIAAKVIAVSIDPTPILIDGLTYLICAISSFSYLQSICHYI